MALIDLTLPIAPCDHLSPVTQVEEVPLICRGENLTGQVYHFRHDSMAGTYLDLPGHLKETDDEADAANYPPEKLFRIRAGVIHLERRDESGGVTANELAHSAPDLSGCGALIINALGKTPFHAITYRSVYLTHDAAHWIAASGIHLLVSDIYESRTLSEGIFPLLFRHGISTVCHPQHLDRLTTPYVDLTVLAPRFEGVTQLPCRVLAESSTL